MVQKSAIRNWHLEAYREGRIDEIPEHLLPLVKAAVEGLRPLAIERPADASDEPVKKTAKGWEVVE